MRKIFNKSWAKSLFCYLLNLSKYVMSNNLVLYIQSKVTRYNLAEAIANGDEVAVTLCLR